MALLLFHAKIEDWNTENALEAARLLAADAGTPGRDEMLSAAMKQAALRDPGKAVTALATLPQDVQGTAAQLRLPERS